MEVVLKNFGRWGMGVLQASPEVPQASLDGPYCSLPFSEELQEHKKDLAFLWWTCRHVTGQCGPPSNRGQQRPHSIAIHTVQNAVCHVIFHLRKTWGHPEETGRLSMDSRLALSLWESCDPNIPDGFWETWL